MSEYEKQVQHLARMCLIEGAKHYAWQRLQELDQEPLFKGIKADVLGRIGSSRKQGKDGDYEEGDSLGY